MARCDYSPPFSHANDGPEHKALRQAFGQVASEQQRVSEACWRGKPFP
ncbi:MAG TPA: hypothetical protein VKA46_14850 [Gemmataceae bacterium]|nr:hypothetical protein [Gemmataceae bacterium]